MTFYLKASFAGVLVALSVTSTAVLARMSLPGMVCQPEMQPPLQPLRTTGFGSALLNSGDGPILVSCPIHRVGENMADLWINVQVDPAGVVADGQMDCHAVREAMAAGLPPALEQVKATIPLDKPGTKDIRFPDFKTSAGASDVYVITCSLPPKVAIKGYNWEVK